MTLEEMSEEQAIGPYLPRMEGLPTHDGLVSDLLSGEFVFFPEHTEEHETEEKDGSEPPTNTDNPGKHSSTEEIF